MLRAEITYYYNKDDKEGEKVKEKLQQLKKLWHESEKDLIVEAALGSQQKSYSTAAGVEPAISRVRRRTEIWRLSH